MRNVSMVLAGIMVVCGTEAQAGSLFLDTYNVSPDMADGYYDINYQVGLRQSGSLAPRTYLEDSGSAGGSFPYLTQVDNPGTRNALLLATSSPAGRNFTWVSPNQDFLSAAPLNIHVEVDPFGPGSSPSPDHWAALVFGTTPGSFIIGTGTGVLLREGGNYELWNNGALASSGNVGAKSGFYAVDFDVDQATGTFGLRIDGGLIFSGSHGPYATNFVTLESYSGGGSDAFQVDYFDNLSVSAVPEPATMSLLAAGAIGLVGARLRKRKVAAPAVA